jgi:hypothetical protein
MESDNKWAKVTVHRETLAKLGILADQSYRSIPATIRYLVDRELARTEVTAAQVAALPATEPEPCEFDRGS